MEITTNKKTNEPSNLTHSIMMQIVSTDGSVKKLAVRYNQNDYWGTCCTGMVDNAELISSNILPSIHQDAKAVGVLVEIMDIGMQKIVFRFKPYILKPELLDINSKLNKPNFKLLN